MERWMDGYKYTCNTCNHVHAFKHAHCALYINYIFNKTVEINKWNRSVNEGRRSRTDVRVNNRQY